MIRLLCYDNRAGRLYIERLILERVHTLQEEAAWIKEHLNADTSARTTHQFEDLLSSKYKRSSANAMSMICGPLNKSLITSLYASRGSRGGSSKTISSNSRTIPASSAGTKRTNASASCVRNWPASFIAFLAASSPPGSTWTPQPSAATSKRTSGLDYFRPLSGS